MIFEVAGHEDRTNTVLQISDVCASCSAGTMAFMFSYSLSMFYFFITLIISLHLFFSFTLIILLMNCVIILQIRRKRFSHIGTKRLELSTLRHQTGSLHKHL